MCDDVVDKVVFMVSYSFHGEFAGFLELAVGCAKMGLEIDLILLNWIHLVPGFNCALEFPRPVNNRIGDVDRPDLGVRGSRQFLLF